MSETCIEPERVVRAVDNYAESEIRDAAKYDNRTPLDESGIYSLHILAAAVYAMGYSAGESSAASRSRAAHQRRTDRERKEARDE